MGESHGNDGDDQAGPDQPGPLVVRWAGGPPRSLAPGGTYVAGRQGDLDLGDEPTMHRRVVSFTEVGGRWFVCNLLEGKRLTVTPRGTGGPVTLPPGEDAPLPTGSARLSFRIGADLRTLDVVAPPPARPGAVPQSALRVRTATAAAPLEVHLTPTLHLLAVAMAELQLLDARSSTIPTKAEVCERLGWSERQYDRSLVRLCEALAKAGVPGVVRDGEQLALQRQEVAVGALLDNGVVTYADLEVLPPL